MYLYHFTLTAQTAEWKERLPLELKIFVWFQAPQTNDRILLFTASLLEAQHPRDNAENKPASLLVVRLGKALPSCCFLHVAEVDRRPVNPKRACHISLITFSW